MYEKGNVMPQVGRKDPCPCGSGKRYKHCCGQEAPPQVVDKRGAQPVFVRGFKAHCDGRLDEAALAYRRALEIYPNHPDALHFLGMILSEKGDIRQAYTLVKRSLTLKKNDADYWANAAMLEERLGLLQEGVASYRQSLKLIPDHAERRMRLGSLLLLAGQATESANELKRAVGLNPALGQAWFLLGNALLQLPKANVEGALSAYRNAYSRLPRNAELNISLGTALMLTEQPEKAREVLEEAVSLEPGNAKAWVNLAGVWMERGAAEKSIECYKKALTHLPDNIDVISALGVAYKRIGEFAEALRCFERVLELQPDDIKALAQQLDLKRIEDVTDPALIRMMNLVDNKETDSSKVSLCFSLGKVFDKLEEYDKAFKYYKMGNELSAKAPVDRSEYRAFVDRKIQRYTRDYMGQLSQWASTSEQPVFIIGMPRSGTTLTEQILSSHPDVAGGGERGLWLYIDKKIELGEWDVNEKTAKEIIGRALEDMATVSGSAASRFVTDKMPDNFKHVGLIHSFFPNARFIHVRRHPVDNCLSIFFQNFRGHDYSHRLDDLAFYYREYRRLMDHWRVVIPADRLFEFDYEELVADQETVTRRLLDFCGLEWNPACLDFHENKRVVKTASILQVRQKLYSNSVARWKNYEAHLGDLMPLLDVRM